mmetsp:Transcript_7660/g.11599  ORF Transcript_7660/g.11599 Transcript_7660/m.11599 type:complete len:895 (+) Transcript_7660:85-2769(+)
MDVKVTEVKKSSPKNGFSAAIRDKWVKLTSTYYQKIDLYEMQWGKLDLSNYHVAIAPYGGLIAIAAKDSKNSEKTEFKQPQKNMIRIFTSAGQLVSEFFWPHKGLVGMGWTDTEDLVVVIAEGKNNVFIKSMHGKEVVAPFSLGNSKTVVDCSIWGNGLVCRSVGDKYEYFVVESFSRRSVVRLQGPAVTFKPTAMIPIPAELSLSGSLQILLASPQGSIFVVSNGEPKEFTGTIKDERAFSDPFLKMALSPSGEHLAAVNSIGTLLVMKSDFSKTVIEFVTRHDKPPLDVAWCGEDSVLLYWEHILIMVGPYCAFVAFKYDGTSPGELCLHTESDGCRVITNTSCELLRKVPDDMRKAFSPLYRPQKVAEPASLLLAASQAYQMEKIEADFYIRQLRGNGNNDEKIKGAVRTCLEGALHSFDTESQTALLQAASFGKLFCDDKKGRLREMYVERCRWVKVFHNTRSSSIGLPLTYNQFMRLGLEVLVDRLVQRHEHFLALRICDLMQLKANKEGVLQHWACALIRETQSEDAKKLGEQIIRKLRICPGISFGRIAMTAFESGMKDLATMVLEKEPRSTDQVKLLLSMDQEQRAMKKAVESNDSNLIYSVLLHLVQSRLPDIDDSELTEGEREARNEFYDILRDDRQGRVLNHLIAYYEDGPIDGVSTAGRQALHGLKCVLHELKMQAEAAKVEVIESYLKTDFKSRTKMLQIASGLFNDPYSATATRAQIRLLQIQRKCEVDFKKAFTDLSVNETIVKLIKLGHTDRAVRIRKEFAVPEKRYWHIQVRALAEEEDWGGLWNLATSKRVPPIGYEPFIESCIENKAITEAVKYIKKLSASNEKMEWFCNIQCFGEAAEVAHADQNKEALIYISSRAKGKPSVKARIDEMIKELG